MNPRRFNVALSFPGEHREFVSGVASCLAEKLGKPQILYDKYHEAEFARPNLDVHLPNLYRKESDLIAIFLCAEYAKKRWCTLEWRFIRQLIQTSDEDRIMFLSFDVVGEIPEVGILSGDGYVFIDKRSPNEIAGLIMQRLDSIPVPLIGNRDLAPTVGLPVLITVLLPDDHRTFGKDKTNALRSILAQEAGVEPDQIATLRTKAGSTKVEIEITEEVAKRLLAKYTTGQGLLRDRGVIGINAQLPQEEGVKSVSVRRLRTAPWALVGRESELSRLDQIADEGQIHVLTLVAWGGVGKTSLVAAWMSQLATGDWRMFERVFDWSFYSQGTREQGAASADSFIAEALKFFGDESMAESAVSPWDKGARLAELIAEQRSLLVLDGLEPLQHGPGPLAGELKDPALATLLRGLAHRNPGLCILTTRERVANLSPFRETTAQEWALEHLSDKAGAALLHQAGATCAGNVVIKPDAPELQAASREVQGHALTLSLLGSYLALAERGDIRKRALVKFEDADREFITNSADADKPYGHAFKVMAAYEEWLKSGGENGLRQLAVLRLLGLFDRPADGGCFAGLRKGPAIAGLSEPLVNLSDAQWNVTITRLAECGLVSFTSENPQSAIRNPQSVDAHPLLREYFGKQLREKNLAAWRAAHKRLYEHLCATTKERLRPMLADLQPLYQAVAHGCQAGLQQEARAKVYRDRILRGTGSGGFYSSKELGALGANLGAVACFFEQPWKRVSSAFKEADEAWLLNEAAFCLGALGRSTEALEPMRAGLENYARQETWKAAAIAAGNLSELELTLGDVAAAVRDAEQSVTYADRSDDAFQRIGKRTTQADALHQAGRRTEAEARFREAEAQQAETQPEFPMLYSLQGSRYCDLLLTGSERAAWAATLELGDFSSLFSLGELPQSEARQFSTGGSGDKSPHSRALRAVYLRAAQTLPIAERNNWLLDIALDRLTLGRAALYTLILEPAKPQLGPAIAHTTAAVEGLRRAGDQQYLPLSFLARAWLLCFYAKHTGSESAQTDLDAAWEIAERGPMRLFMADIHLYRARLFHAVKPYPWTSPQEDLAAARKLIEQCGYWRRKEELEDAEAAAKNW